MPDPSPLDLRLIEEALLRMRSLVPHADAHIREREAAVAAHVAALAAVQRVREELERLHTAHRIHVHHLYALIYCPECKGASDA